MVILGCFDKVDLQHTKPIMLTLYVCSSCMNALYLATIPLQIVSYYYSAWKCMLLLCLCSALFPSLILLIANISSHLIRYLVDLPISDGYCQKEGEMFWYWIIQVPYSGLRWWDMWYKFDYLTIWILKIGCPRPNFTFSFAFITAYNTKLPLCLFHFDPLFSCKLDSRDKFLPWTVCEGHNYLLKLVH